MTEQKTILVTGGAGFIGSALVRHIIRETQHYVVNVDKLTYAGRLESLAAVAGDARYAFERIDIGDRRRVERVFREYRPGAVMNLAAESHVDRSIDAPAAFIQTNIIGTYTLLEVAREYWSQLSSTARDAFRFHHVSTDEVYGDLDGTSERSTEVARYVPSSPYAASKASSDHLVRAWQRTYGLPTLITNCSNNYGPYHFPEKLIPLAILNALEGQPLPVYGKGDQVRDWLYVEDHVRALYTVLTRAAPGSTYNVGARSEKRNIDVVRAICGILDRVRPDPSGSYERLISFVADRPGHDRRYAIDAGKIERELGWRPYETFESGLEKTVQWYLDNSGWTSRARSAAYQGRRRLAYGGRGVSA